MKPRTVWAFFFLLIVASLATLGMGETPWNQLWQGILQRFHGDQSWHPLLDERLPRLIVLLCTGASLSVAGAVMQSLFSNPLASPAVLGINCGGSLIVTIAFVLDLHLSYPFALPLAAFLGCLVTLISVYSAARHQGQVQLTTLILTGIAVSTLLLAIQGAISYALRDRWQLIQTLSEWEAGSTFDRNWKHVHMQLPLTLVGLLGALRYRTEINILTLGEEEALNLGVEVQQVRWHLFLCIALLTGGAIAALGNVAFFGLILPHLIRRIQGPDNRALMPACILIGGTTLILLDLFLRFFSLYAFSIGNISAILGGIFFLLLIYDLRRERSIALC